ncbi:ABC transporter ATP-binding protein [uncultured Roseibium sp.]|uniref:ABC transporter ATP-binding protein n=1 Tax=uncultured Roseibium sp. TaxID=1936171 RepID=UPI003216CBC8
MSQLNDVVIETRGLTKSFGGFIAVHHLDLQVRRGTIHALIGPNGAGKSTCFNLITKFHQPTAGQILYDGQDITRLSPARIARMGMVRSFQISAVFPHLSVLENVRVALQRTKGWSTQFWRHQSVLNVLNERALELLEDVGLAEFAQETAGSLSYGRKRALEFATTLALDPKVLLLDEPMAGMGGEDIDRIAKLIRRVADGRTVLMVEHNLNVVSELSDHITVLQHGALLAEGSYQQVSSDQRVIEAYLGTGDQGTS